MMRLAITKPSGVTAAPVLRPAVDGQEVAFTT
jgi:hypothetical protein